MKKYNIKTFSLNRWTKPFEFLMWRRDIAHQALAAMEPRCDTVEECARFLRRTIGRMFYIHEGSHHVAICKRYGNPTCYARVVRDLAV